MATASRTRRIEAPSAAPLSPLDEALRRVGDRWTLLVVEALLPGPRRFGELLEALEGLAPNILSRRLKALEADGLVAAAPYSRRPYRVAYALTAPGAELAGALRLLAQWGSHRTPGGSAPLHHATCGTAVEARWWCPTCERDVADDEAPDLHFL
jgi:DNA-binding HxlR family transcriptional regulator